MSPWPAESCDPETSLGLGALLIILVFVMLTGAERRRAAGRIRLAAPAYVPLHGEAAGRLADELGSLVAAVLAAERDREGQP